ncbi:MAG TPA: hypothetical protein VGR14_17890 [Verrucomicrobiae bacterium]|nr:hypothetical protein [Verrucomicrobiae bacterium]
MNNDLPVDPNPPPNRGGKFRFLLIALAPMPLRLFTIGSQALQSPHPRFAMHWLDVLSFAVCLYGSIGMCGGFEGKSRPSSWFNGFMIGIALFVVEGWIVAFVGCAVTLNNI